jgi:hypothetical protein
MIRLPKEPKVKDDTTESARSKFGWRWSWWFVLLLMLGPTISMMRTRSADIFWQATLTPSGLVVQEGSKSLGEITFGMSLEQVRSLLGQETHFNDNLLIYSPIGLNIYLDEQGVSMIGYFSGSAASAKWHLGNSSIEAGFFGQPLNRAIKTVSAQGTLLHSDADRASFSLMGNILRIESDTRGRLGMIVYSQKEQQSSPAQPQPLALQTSST